jgi:hypothetical protein
MINSKRSVYEMRFLSELPPLDKRSQRRKEVEYLLLRLGLVLEAEERCRDNTPENFQDTDAFAQTEEYIEMLEAAVESLGEVYC